MQTASAPHHYPRPSSELIGASRSAWTGTPKMASAHILVVDDEPDISALVAYHLARESYRVRTAASGPEAIRAVELERPDLVVLDLMLPGMSGLQVLEELRRRPETQEIPVILLTARREEQDRIAGLELGADDYVAKPFSPRELVARVRAILRRGTRAAGAGPATAPATFALDEERRQIRYYGQLLPLSRYEYGLLCVLVRRPGRVFTRDELLARVWDDDSTSFDRTVDAHVKTLRAKLKAVAPSLEPIRTARGSGYALAEDLPSARPL